MKVFRQLATLAALGALAGCSPPEPEGEGPGAPAATAAPEGEKTPPAGPPKGPPAVPDEKR
jgi:hypothetical protein